MIFYTVTQLKLWRESVKSKLHNPIIITPLPFFRRHHKHSTTYNHKNKTSNLALQSVPSRRWTVVIH